MLLKAPIVSPGPLALWRYQRLPPGTLYQFTGPTLPAPFSSLRRTGLGTMIGSDGLVRYGPHNLLWPSANFTSAQWIANAAATDDGAGSEIDGTPTRRFTSSSFGGGWYNNFRTVVAGDVVTFNYYVSRVSGTRYFLCGCDSLSQTLASFNPADGTFASGPAAKGAVAVPGGWRVWVTYTFASGGNISSTVYAGGVGSGSATFDVVAWSHVGATLLPYVPTTTAAVYLPRSPTYSSAAVVLGLLSEGQATNLMGQTDDLTGAEWGRSNLNTPTEGGSYQGRKTWVISATTTGFAFLNQSLGTATGKYSAVVSLWAGTSDSIRLGLYLNTTGWTGHTAVKLSGPGTTSTDADLPSYIFGLSETEPTVVRLTSGVGNGSEGSALYIYPDFGPGQRAGFTNRIQVNNVEAGVLSSSYIPNSGTSTLARTADDLTITGPEFVDLFYNLGANLVTNGTFDADANWNLSAGVAITGGQAVFTSVAQFAGMSQAAAVNYEIGKRYLVSLNLTGSSAGTGLLVRIGGSGDFTSTGSTPGVKRYVLTANGNSALLQILAASASTTLTIDSVSVQEVLGDRGAEMAVNGGFAADTNWTKGTGWTISGGTANQAAGSSSTIDQAIAFVAGRTYSVTYTVSGYTGSGGSTGRFRIFGGTTVNGTFRTADGTYTETFVALAGNVTFSFASTTVAIGCTIDNVSVREVILEGTTAVRFWYDVNQEPLRVDWPGLLRLAGVAGTDLGLSVYANSRQVILHTRGPGGNMDTYASPVLATGWHVAAVAWSATAVKASVDGGPVVTSSGATPTGLTDLRIGRFDSWAWNMPIAGIRIVKNRAVSDSELRELSKL